MRFSIGALLVLPLAVVAVLRPRTYFHVAIVVNSKTPPDTTRVSVFAKGACTTPDSPTDDWETMLIEIDGTNVECTNVCVR